MLHTTGNIANKAQACGTSVQKMKLALGKGYGWDTPIPLTKILEVCGLNDALWCLHWVLPDEQEQANKIAVLFACHCAEHTLPLFEHQYPDDKRPRQAIEVARYVVKYGAAGAAGEAARAAGEAAAGEAEMEWQKKAFQEYLDGVIGSR